MTNHTPEPTILDRLNHLADGLNNLRDNSKDDYDRGYIAAMMEEVDLMISNVCEEFNNANGPMHMGEPVISNPFMDKLAAVTAQRDELLATMHKIACLGNGDKFGNSDGNLIAQDAIAKCEVKP